MKRFSFYYLLVTYIYGGNLKCHDHLLKHKGDSVKPVDIEESVMNESADCLMFSSVTSFFTTEGDQFVFKKTN